MPEPLDPQLIDRYIAGDASPAEIAEVQARTEQDAAWAAAIAGLRETFARRDRQAPDRWNTDAAWSRLAPRVTPGQDVPTLVGRRSAARPHRASWFADRRWQLAAAVLIVAGTAVLWRGAARGRDVTSSRVAMHEITTPNGARHSLTLDDGSRVTLNAGSRLRWAPDFGARSRDVALDGEAYFTVTHDAARPFRVHARGAVAHDLGTRFTVRAYPELPGLEVVVAEGKVSLRSDRPGADSAILSVGQLGRLGPSGSPTVESNVAVDRWTAWTNGSLVLDGLTLTEALPQLERWYDATITVTDPQLAARRVSARFHDETLPQMLDALALALDARWQQSGRSITLSPTNR